VSLSYKTRSTKGDICAEDSLENVGMTCEVEEDCGGSSSEDVGGAIGVGRSTRR